MGFQTSDVKEIEVKVIDNSISRSVSVGKKFFVYRPQRVSSSSTSELGTDQSSADEFHGMLEKELKEQLPGLDIKVSDEYGLPADAKEAVGFALLANEALHGHTNHLPAATGARHSAILGMILPGRLDSI